LTSFSNSQIKLFLILLEKNATHLTDNQTKD